MHCCQKLDSSDGAVEIERSPVKIRTGEVITKRERILNLEAITKNASVRTVKQIAHVGSRGLHDSWFHNYQT